MRVVKKNVYYCDFCKKHSLLPLTKHERHCTGNPNRECRLCDNAPIAPIIEKYNSKLSSEFTLQTIIDELDYECPNCILAIIRGLATRHDLMVRSYGWEYKRELSKWWDQQNDFWHEKNQRDMYE